MVRLLLQGDRYSWTAASGRGIGEM